MFRKEKIRLRIAIISISLVVLLASFTTVFLVLNGNINKEANSSIERTIHSLNLPSDHDEFAPMEVIVIKDNNGTMEYSMDSTRRYNVSTLNNIVSKAKDKKEARIDSHYFYLASVNTNEGVTYIAYDATLAMINLTTLLISFLT